MKIIFQCDQCAKQFKQIGHMVAHKRTHIGEKPFPCDQCPKAFKQVVSC